MSTRNKIRLGNFLVGVAFVGIVTLLILYQLDLLATTSPKNFDFDSFDPYNPNQKYDGTILLKSKSFTEYSPIDVDVTLQVVNGTLPQTLYIIFPDSYNYPEEHSGFGSQIGGGWIPLTMDSYNHYTGHGQIQYQNAGEYWFGVTFHLPSEITGPKSTKADNRIVIKEKGSDLPSITDRITVAGTLLPLAVVILFSRPIARKFFLNPNGEEAKNAAEREDSKKKADTLKGKKPRR